MSAELRAMYRELLFQDDQDLLEWVMARSATPEPRWQPVIAAIRRFHQLDA
jgi:succinate dehydrogenase flavin-adding protein (antitoxin of CptAB toxin-antitoxin module)